MADSILSAAIRTVKEGLSANEGLRQALSAGLHVQRQTWLRMVGTVQRDLADQISEVTRPLNRKPGPDEIHGYVSKRATGYIHYVDVMVKDRATGAVVFRPYSVKRSALLTRREAVNEALAGFRKAILDSPSEYDEQVLGAVHTATYQYIPED